MTTMAVAIVIAARLVNAVGVPPPGTGKTVFMMNCTAKMAVTASTMAWAREGDAESSADRGIGGSGTSETIRRADAAASRADAPTSSNSVPVSRAVLAARAA